ncbi:MAG: DNA polymerase III subunit gamma/tau, partial [Paracoccaceae bacterium]
AEDPTVGPDERARGQTMAEGLPLRALARMWQMLLKALDEVAQAPNAMMAAEMAVIRLTHVADLPTPEELVRKLPDLPPPSPGGGPGGGMVAGGMDSGASAMTRGGSVPSGNGGGSTVQAVALDADQALARFPTFDHVVDLIRANRDVKLLVEVETGVQLAAYRPGRIEFVPAEGAASDLAQRLGQRLQLWTGNRWAVSLVNEGGAPSIAAARDATEANLKAEVEAHPMMQAVLSAFPKARITEIRTPDKLAAAAQTEALPEVEDEWDPFEDD